MRNDRIKRIKDRLVTIAEEDTLLVRETRAALLRSVELGFTPSKLAALLDADEPELHHATEKPPDDYQYHGFKSRRQALLALYSLMGKTNRPAVLGDASERVSNMVKNQEPERAQPTIGLAIIAVPAMSPVGELPQQPMKVFRRSSNGQLRELAPVDVEATEVAK